MNKLKYCTNETKKLEQKKNESLTNVDVT